MLDSKRLAIMTNIIPIVIGIGSNINREQAMASGLSALSAQFSDLEASSIYENPAIGFDGPPFYNQVVKFTTDLPITAVAALLYQIELEHGRPPKGHRFISRTLDLDLLLYGDQIHEDNVQVPHPDILNYAFVLRPLAQIAGSQQHPTVKKTFTELWHAFDKTGVSLRVVG
jgi:2-amino-4-hydroxy-6-hydroxymethyldihydropteridine diphosphokinase